MRLFVAVDLPSEIRDALESDVVARLRDAVPGARWTRPEGRHLTLKFLGEVADEGVDAVEDALAGTLEGAGPFDAARRELGAFPSFRRARVLWVGADEGAAAMPALAARVDDALEPLGFAREARPF